MDNPWRLLRLEAPSVDEADEAAVAASDPAAKPATTVARAPTAAATKDRLGRR